MKNIVVFGASGQLGHCLKNVADRKGITSIYFPSEEEANILDKACIERVFETFKPTYCINCAAYTAVDKAEDEVQLSRKINKDGALYLAEACAKYNAVLVHVSTDFVFEGNKPALLTEEDVALPINVYGLTKLEGEQAIIDAFDNYYILRTSWLYSEYGNNFVKTMLKLGAERDELKIIADQVGTPTYAIDLADCILTIIESDMDAYGLYHYSNEGVTSWYDFAKGIFDISNTQVRLLPIKTTEYPTKALRPAFSVMDKTKIKNTFKIEIPYWRDSLIKCIEKL